jgi:hypothetical protein
LEGFTHKLTINDKLKWIHILNINKDSAPADECSPNKEFL